MLSNYLSSYGNTGTAGRYSDIDYHLPHESNSPAIQILTTTCHMKATHSSVLSVEENIGIRPKVDSVIPMMTRRIN